MTKKKKPNIVCFIMDDTDFTNISCYGGDIPTPNIDSIGKEGIIFTNFYCSSSVCTPSRYSYMSGRYAGRCSYVDFIKGNPKKDLHSVGWNVVLTENDPISAGRILKEAGYSTAYIGKWHAGRPSNALNLPQFNENEDPFDENTNNKLINHQKILCDELKKSLGFDYASSIFWNNAEALPLKKLRHHNIDWLTYGAINFLENQNNEDPFFLYMATTTYHGPDQQRSFFKDPRITPGGIVQDLSKVSSNREKILEKLKESGLEKNHRTIGMVWTDEAIKSVIKKVKDMGELENTVFIFSVDHNTENGKASCYESGTRIPFMMKWPGRITPGSVTAAKAQNIDLVPTLLEIAGTQIPDNSKLDGKSLSPLFDDQKNKIHNDLYFEFGFSRAVLCEEWKYIAVRYTKDLYEKMENNILEEAPNLLNLPNQGQCKINIHAFPNCLEADQLYNLSEDPREENNLAAQPEYQNILKEMKRLLKKYTSTFSNPFPEEAPPFHKSEKFRLLVQKAKENHPLNDIRWYPNPTTQKRRWPPKIDHLQA